MTIYIRGLFITLILTLMTLPMAFAMKGTTAGETMSKEVSGQLYSITSYDASGLATLKELDGQKKLVLSDISVTRVPDGQVFLAVDGNYSEGLKVGDLKTFRGEVAFDLPDGTDLSAYNSVVIWCVAFNVGIGQADLN